MSNLSLNESTSNNLSVSTQEIPSLDQLLYVLGFTEWEIITSTFVLPALSFIGLVLCTLSFWIFLQEKFKDPVFFYYRLLCLVYIIHLAHNTPSGLLFTPRYFPKISTYSTSIYQIWHITTRGCYIKKIKNKAEWLYHSFITTLFNSSHFFC
jgi:hypothetical protein